MPGEAKERKLEAAGEGLQIAAVGNHGGGEGLEPPGAQLLQESLGAMRFAGHHQGHALAAIGLGPAHPDLHAQLAGQTRQSGAISAAVGRRPRPGGLEGHAELPAGDLFFQGLDIGALLKKEIGDGGHDPGSVAANDGESGKLLHAGSDYCLDPNLIPNADPLIAGSD